MPERERGDGPQQSEVNVTEQFFSMRLVEFRDYIDSLWKENKDTKIVIFMPEKYMLTEQAKNYLLNLQLDSRVKVVK